MKRAKIHILFFTFLLFLIFSPFDDASASNTGVVSATVQLAVCGNGIKDIGEQCDSGNLDEKSCTDLGYDGGTLSCSPACEFDTTSCTTSATASADTDLSPSADRTYILPDGSDSAGIDLPASFYPSDLSLFLFSHPSAPNVPDGQSLVGKLYNLLFVNENGETVHQIDKASTITLSYSNTDLNTVDESTLAPYRSEDGGSTWSAINDYALDRTAKTITFDTSDFSFFSIFGHAFSNNNNNNNTGGGGGNTRGGSSGSGGWNLPKATPAEKKKIINAADFNGDGRVDLSDLSILLYYENFGSYNRLYDLNGDGRIDITDVSIMLYYWEVTS